MGQQQEGAQMQNIDLQVGQQRQQLQQQAQQNYLQTLGQTAAAQAQQAGLEFESQQQRAQQVLGLGREQLGQSMALEDQLFGAEQAKAAAVQQARSAIWSGIGGIASGIGGGMMQMQAGQNQMDMLSQIYGNKSTINPALGASYSDKQQAMATAAMFSGTPSVRSLIAPNAGVQTSLASNPLLAPKPLQNVQNQGWAY
jgi:hypothetical protein